MTSMSSTFIRSFKLTRRHFLQNAAAITAGSLAAPLVLPAAVLGRDEKTPPPSERVIMGLIGCGQHGSGWNLDLMLNNPMQQVVAVCDVDKKRTANAQKRTNEFYSKKSGTDYKGCSIYGDFRDLVNRKDIDAVDIATPNHWHVLMSVSAMKAGKDVICEKPTWSIREGQILCETVKKTGRIFQTATEGRSIDAFQQIINLSRNGHLGKIRHFKILMPPGNTLARSSDKTAASTQPQDVPPELDYEMWLGPAPKKPYIPARSHYSWRWNFDYGGGNVADWAVHFTNIMQACLDADTTGPVKLTGKADTELPPFDAVWNTPEKMSGTGEYASGVTFETITEVPGIKVEGTKGWVLMRGWRQALRASDEKLLQITFDGEPRYGRPESTVKNADRGAAGGEHIDFALSVKSRKPCYYPAEAGHRVDTIAHGQNISMLLKQKYGKDITLHWNPQTEKFEGEYADEANSHWCYDRPQREPWTFENVDSWINVG